MDHLPFLMLPTAFVLMFLGFPVASLERGGTPPRCSPKSEEA